MYSPFKTLHTDPIRLQQMATCLTMVRRFFADRDVMEVLTPALAATTVPDPHIASIACGLHAANTTAYLQTSPEFAMKRLLAAGSGCIYQIASAFRDDAASPIHKVEFTLLEWYRVGWDYHALIQEVHALLQLFWPDIPLVVRSYQEIFLDWLGIDIPTITLADLQALLVEQAQITSTFTSIDAALDAAMSLLIQPQLQQIPLLCIRDYPLSQAALARPSTRNPAVAERFEFFLHGVELANGFSELTDPVEQRRRFEKDNVMRAAMGLPIRELDEDFLAALPTMPDCAGVALGIDRLFMQWASISTI